MGVRKNLCPQPVPAASGIQWFGPSGWARSTSGHASLPRTVVWTGTTVPADITTPKFTCVAGKYYVGDVWVRFVGPSTGQVNIDWYAAGNVYLSTTNGPTFNQAGGTTAQLHTGSLLAPTDAVAGLVNVASVDAEAQGTACMVQEFATLGAADAADHTYFDGDSANSVWDGTAGSSTSTETTAAPVVFTGALSSPTGYLSGIRESFGALVGALQSPTGAVGLVANVFYDPSRDRVRVSASGMRIDTVRAVVSSRRVGTSRWAEVRGGKVSVSGGRFTHFVDDYEFTAGSSMEYRIVGYLTSEQVAPVIGQTTIVQVDEPASLDDVWIKFIPQPAMNRRVQFVDFTEVERADRNAAYDVTGRREPVVVTDVHGSRSTTITLLTDTDLDGEGLDAALSAGSPAFLRMPTSIPLPSMYVAIGRYRWRYVTKLGGAQDRVWTVPITEVSAPPPSVVGAVATYQTLLDRFGTYHDLLDTYDTYLAVMG